MEACELYHRLSHLDFGAVHLLLEGGNCQPALYHHFAPFGDCLESALTEPVPCIHIDPHGFVFVSVGGELFHCNGELNHLVTCISEGDCVRILSDVSDDHYCVVHLAPPVRVSAKGKDTSVSRASAFRRLHGRAAARPEGVCHCSTEKSCQSRHVKTCTGGSHKKQTHRQSSTANNSR